MELRACFPALGRVAYLNAGSCGPVPAEAVVAARAALAGALHHGRGLAHFEARLEAATALREGYARVLGADPGEVALTTSTSEGIGKVLAGLDLGPGDEIVTSDEEHPGVTGPLIAARERGARVRVVPFAELADAVGPGTTYVVCSHVSWITGAVAPEALRDAGVPVVLDGAQGAGAVPVDVRALGCAAYAAAGQKWLCGADGTGMLWVAPELDERLRAVAPAYMNLAEPARGMESALHPGGRRHDTPSLPREGLALSLAALRVLERLGLAEAHRRAAALAARLADALRERGRAVAPRGETTLVSWEEDDPEALSARCAAAGVVIRHLPGTPYARASVGAWNDESDLERLLACL